MNTIKKGTVQAEFKVAIEITLTPDMISSLLTGALDPDCGLSYTWCRLDEKIEPTVWAFTSDPQLDESESVHYREDYPLNPGGALLLVGVDDDDDEVRRLDKAAIEKGLRLLAEKYPEILLRVASEQSDAEDSDTFLQCCLFGEIVYC